MKKISRKQMVATAILIFGIAAAGLGASAAETNGNGNPINGLVKAIAQKFNLNEAEVQAVFDQQRTQGEANRQTKFEAKLNGLVAAGKLTQAQADLIKTKRTELETQMQAQRESWRAETESLKDKTQSERKAAMEAQKTKMEAVRAALEQWAKDNNIPEEYLPMCGAGGLAGHGRGGRFGQ